jgi:hypothetical protein
MFDSLNAKVWIFLVRCILACFIVGGIYGGTTLSHDFESAIVAILFERSGGGNCEAISDSQFPTERREF